MSGPQVTTLENGVRVVTEKMPDVRSASLGVWVSAGARHEEMSEHGIAHFLEHMAFKGTQKRSALAIAQEIEAVGGDLNACTMREQTSYYARVLSDDVPLALDILADIINDSTFESDELTREQQVVLQEIAQVQDTPDDLVFDDLQSVCFPENALGRTILGTPESVASLKRDDLFRYMTKHYTAEQLILAAAGDVDHDQIVVQAQDLFGARIGSSVAGAEIAGAKKPVFTASESRRHKESEQAHVSIAFEGVPFGHPDFFTAQVYTAILGGGMSSRLFQEVREKRGLCYSVFSFSSSYRDTGVLGVYAGTGAGALSELVPVIIEQMKCLSDDANDEEVARAASQLKAGLFMGREASAMRAEQAARELMNFDRLFTPDELVAEVDKVDADAIRQFGQKLLRESKPALAAVGAIDNLAPYDRIVAEFG